MFAFTESSQNRRPQWTLGDRLRKARDEAGKTQTDIALLLDCSEQTITNYERDRSVPRTIDLAAWAFECGVELEWIVGGVDPENAPMAHRKPRGPRPGQPRKADREVSDATSVTLGETSQHHYAWAERPMERVA